MMVKYQLKYMCLYMLFTKNTRLVARVPIKIMSTSQRVDFRAQSTFRTMSMDHTKWSIPFEHGRYDGHQRTGNCSVDFDANLPAESKDRMSLKYVK